ncbi:MAG: imidazolonepropionase, partial [Myxococcota bacterium]
MATGNAGSLVVRGLSELWTGTEILREAAVLVEGGRVAWVGASADAPRGDDEVDAAGLVGMPGLVDPHTHTTFAGSRAADFERRLAGETYTQILEAGG